MWKVNRSRCGLKLESRELIHMVAHTVPPARVLFVFDGMATSDKEKCPRFCSFTFEINVRRHLFLFQSFFYSQFLIWSSPMNKATTDACKVSDVTTLRLCFARKCKQDGEFTVLTLGPIEWLSCVRWPSLGDSFSSDPMQTNQQTRMAWQTRPRETEEIKLCWHGVIYIAIDLLLKQINHLFPSTAFLIFLSNSRNANYNAHGVMQLVWLGGHAGNCVNPVFEFTPMQRRGGLRQRRPVLLLLRCASRS